MVLAFVPEPIAQGASAGIGVSHGLYHWEHGDQLGGAIRTVFAVIPAGGAIRGARKTLGKDVVFTTRRGIIPRSSALADDAAKSGTIWNNGWRTADGKFTSPLGPGRSGQAAVDSVADAIRGKPGWRVVGSEVSVRDASGALRRYDLVVESPNGRLIGVEVKSGSGRLTSYQQAFDEALNASGKDALGVVGRHSELGEIRRAILIEVP